jgi:hypothetical protein
MGDKKRGRFEDTDEPKRPPPAALLAGIFADETEGRTAAPKAEEAEEEVQEQQKPSGAEAEGEEDEVDPLDAFMVGIHDTVKKEKAGIIKPAQAKVRAPLLCSALCAPSASV